MSNSSTATQTVPSLRDIVLQSWNDTGNKVLKLAEAFPADQFDYRPTAEVRTFAEQLRHLAFWNLYVLKTVRGEEFDSNPNELPEAAFATKAKIVKELKRILTETAAELEKASNNVAMDLWLPFIAHSCEHYGQLVVYCRLNGIVPPASA